MNLHHSLHILMMMFLFGKNWNNQDIDVKTRCIMTVTALIASGMINTSLVHHFENAKDVWSIDEGDLSYEDEAVRAHSRHFS